MPFREPSSCTSRLKNAVISATRAACCMLCVTITSVYSRLSSCIKSSIAVVEHLAVDSRARDEVVHAVEAPQHRRLATARRPDQRGDCVPMDAKRHVPDRHRAAVANAEVTDVENGLARDGGDVGLGDGNR